MYLMFDHIVHMLRAEVWTAGEGRQCGIQPTSNIQNRVVSMSNHMGATTGVWKKCIPGRGETYVLILAIYL